MKNTIPADDSWTLFLDRDGVINKRIKDDYVKKWPEFVFMAGVLESMPVLSNIFGCIVVVTNQQGVGKGKMSRQQLDDIHDRMEKAVVEAGGRIDLILSCTDLSGQSPNCRKPNPDMAYQARAAFPQINFERSVMVGDSISDILFGERLGMTTVWVRGKEDEYQKLWALEGQIRIDYRIGELAELIQILPR